MIDENGWSEWSRHVLAELKRLNNCYEMLDKKLTEVRLEVMGLKIKAGIWGMVGASVPVAIGVAAAIIGLILAR